MKYLVFFVSLFTSIALADTPPPGAVKIKGGTDGTNIGNIGDALKVSGSFSPSGTQNTNIVQFLGATPSAANSLPYRLTNGTSFYDARDRNWTLGFSGDKVDVSGSSVSVSNAFALDSTLTALSAKFNSLGQKTMAGSVPVVISSDQSPITVTGSVTASNPSVDLTGNPVPTSATFIGAKNPTGDLSGLLTNALGGLIVDGSAVTQPVSGAITANIGTTGGLALDSSLSTINTTLGSPFQAGGSIGNAAFGISGTLPAFAATPTFNIGTTGGIALDSTLSALSAKFGTLGQKTMAGSAPVVIASDQSAIPVTGAFFQATQPVSIAGTVAVSGPLTDAQLRATPVPISGTISGSGDFTVVQSTGTNLHTVVDSGAITVSGAVTANAGTNLNTSALQLDVTGAKLNLAQGSATSAQTGPLVQGAVTTAAPTYTTAQTSPLSLTTAGALRIDASGTTQPISGTVAVSNFPATQAVTQSGTWTVQPGNTANTTPWLSTINQGGNSATVTASNALKVDGSAVTQPISGTVTANAGTNLNTSALALSATQTDGTQRTKITDGTTNSAVKAASTAAVASDPALVVAISPNNTIALPSGAATSALQTSGNASLTQIDADLDVALSTRASAANQTNGTQKAQTVDGSGNIQPSGDTAARKIFVQSTDGTNSATVKAASTAAVAGDTGFVVSERPDNVGAVTQTSVSCGTGSTTLLAAATATQFVDIRNPTTSTVTIWINVTNTAAVVGAPSLDIPPGGDAYFSAEGTSYLSSQQINCISSGAASSVTMVYK